MTAGQSGVGKSTLVQNLFHLAPLVGQSLDPVIKEAVSFSGYINGVKITIVDMPDLAATSDDEEKKTIAELIKVTEGGADILLYCANMGPGGKLNELDRKTIKLLTSVFQPQIWERAILVLTFGDIIKERHQKLGTTVKTPTVETVITNYAEAFGKILADSIAQVRVIPVLKDEGAELRPAKEIAAVVSSETTGEEVLPGIKWNTCLYKEVLKKCKRDAVPPMLEILADCVQKEAVGEDTAFYGSQTGSRSTDTIIGAAIAGAIIAGAGAGIAGAITGASAGIAGVITGASAGIAGAIAGVGAATIAGATTGAGVAGSIGAAIVGTVGGGVGGRISVLSVYYKIAYKRYLESEEGIKYYVQLHKEIEELWMKDKTTKGEVQEESKKDK